MKTTAKMIALIFLLAAGIGLVPQKAQAHFGITYQVFYNDLAPYGSWVSSPDYGYVWVPDAGPDFMPYGTNGYWTYSDYGWTWVSYYPWGWAPFHYGRWYYDNWYGWVWVPGTDWGPAWVTWRQCDGYYGWAPMMPGFSVSWTFSWNYVPVPYWVFVPCPFFGRPDIYQHYVNYADNDRLYQRSTVISYTQTDPQTRTRYFAGPGVREVQRTTGRTFKPVRVVADNQPGQRVNRDGMHIYRPEVREAPQNSRTAPAPEKVAPYHGNSGSAVREQRGRDNTGNVQREQQSRDNSVGRSQVRTTSERSGNYGNANSGTRNREMPASNNINTNRQQAPDQRGTYTQPKRESRPPQERPAAPQVQKNTREVRPTGEMSNRTSAGSTPHRQQPAAPHPQQERAKPQGGGNHPRQK